VSIVGGIQPELLQAALSGEHLYDGIASRLMFVAPPERVSKWSDATITDQARQGWNSLLDELLELQPEEDGNPVDLPMADAAKTAWVRYHDDLEERQAEEDGPFRSALSKLQAATARLALLMQLADNPQSAEVGVEAMERGIALSTWFEGQARRVYSGLEDNAQERERRAACDWIANRGGKTTLREFTRYGPGRFRSRAGEVLDDLVAADLAKLSPQSSGRRAAEYVLCDCDPAT
jgi:hypothetical protein